MKHWHILGPGAIGCLWASHLSQANQPCTLLVPDHHALNSTLPLQLHTQRRQYNFNVPREHASAPGRIDNLLVCVKAFQVLPAIETLLGRLHSGSVVMLLHNGLGTLDPLRQLLPKGCRVLQGTLTHGAYCPAPLTVVHAGQGETKLGPGIGELTAAEQQVLVSTLNQAMPPVSWHDDIDTALWLKLAINCAINPLTALEQCRNGELMRTDRLGTVQAVCEECALVLNSREQAEVLCSAELFNLVRGVIEQTAQNYSSMNRDLAAGKTTEVDYITGYLLQEAQRLGLELPANQALYQAIKLQQTNLDPPAQ